ncbi:MAG: HD domain-containing protein, partial [Wenzhouxiangellaceae bacterium]
MSYPAPVRELRRLLNTYLEPEHVAIALHAFEVGEAAHRGQRRKSGEDYILHPVEVASILAGMRMDYQTITAAILHDTVEDTDITIDDLKQEFGDDVARVQVFRPDGTLVRTWGTFGDGPVQFKRPMNLAI